MLHNFTGPDCKFSQAGLVQGPGGVFYGTTTEGGAHIVVESEQLAAPPPDRNGIGVRWGVGHGSLFACWPLLSLLPALPRSGARTALRRLKITQEFGCWRHAGDQQMVACAGAGDVEQVSFRVVYFLQVGIVRDGFDAFLQG